MDTLAEQASANSDPEDNPTAGTGNWLPQLRITKDFFSTKTRPVAITDSQVSKAILSQGRGQKLLTSKL